MKWTSHTGTTQQKNQVSWKKELQEIAKSLK